MNKDNIDNYFNHELAIVIHRMAIETLRTIQNSERLSEGEQYINYQKLTNQVNTLIKMHKEERSNVTKAFILGHLISLQDELFSVSQKLKNPDTEKLLQLYDNIEKSLY